MNDENPYFAPKSNIEVQPETDASNYLTSLPFKDLEKLYYRSCNVTGLSCLLIFFAVIIVTLLTTMNQLSFVVSAVLVILSGLYTFSAIGLLKRSHMGRILGIIVSSIILLNGIINLFNITNMLASFLPICIGLMGLFALTKCPNLFGPDKLEHKLIKAIWKDRKKKKK